MERPQRPDVIDKLIKKVDDESLRPGDLVLLDIDVLEALEYIEKLEVYWK